MSNALRYRCRNCRAKTGPAAFEDVDDEFDAGRPMCPSCKLADFIGRSCCEVCDEPAYASTDTGPLCARHYERYVAGYGSRD